MKQYEDFIEGLRQDTDMPDEVRMKYEDVLENIEQLSNQRKGEYFMRAGRKKSARTWVKAAAVAGIFVTGFSIFTVSNPVAASKLPIIGRIFENVGEDVMFSGDYSGKKVLQEDAADAGGVESTENVSKSGDAIDSALKEPITAKDKGITIMASEVYSDGYSVYLAAEIKSKKGGFLNIPDHYTRRFEEKTSKSIYAGGTWKIGDGEKETLNNASFEGKAVDDNTFIGMMKIDQTKYLESDGRMKLEFTDLYYDDVDVAASEEIEPLHRFFGTWRLDVPFTVDKEQCRELSVKQENDDGFGIEKVFVSPYQIIVFSKVPYTTLSPEDFTREEFDEVWGAKNEEMIAAGEKPVTYEDLLAEKYLVPYEVAVFDQNGKSLERHFGYENKTVFAVQENEITKLHIFMTDGSHDIDLIKAADEKEAQNLSIFDVELELE